MLKEYDKIFLKALQTWGGKAQEDMAIEECSELIKAICKFRRSKKVGIEELNNIIDEVADVTIMMRQMSIIVGEDKVEERIKFKIERLKEMLK
jgi:NTP pyrophosphatase (non-canonical NTP hydrolase)